jgi:hypothetical protein
MGWDGAAVVCAGVVRLVRRRQVSAEKERARLRAAERMPELYSLRRGLRYRVNIGV